MFSSLLNKTAACPYCYTRIAPDKLWYRCSGRPAPGKAKCELSEDSVRVSMLEDATPTYFSFPPEGQPTASNKRPLCPRCQGPTGTRVCPSCHSVIPDKFTANSPMFGIVGVRGSGKTVLLTVLGKELTENVARRFDATIDAVGSSNLLTRLSNARINMDRQGGALPSQTQRKNAVDTVPAVYTVTLEKAGIFGLKQTMSTIFSFYDSAGEDLTTSDRARDQHYLAATDGLILLLDPFGFAANREIALQRGVDPGSLQDEPSVVLNALTQVLREAEHLKAKAKVKKPIAVVLAKIDAFFDQIGPHDPIRSPSAQVPYFDEKESRELHEYVAALVEKWGGGNLRRTLDANYETYRFFVASALGAEPNYRTSQVNSLGVHPHRVAEPLLWLMAGHKLIDIKKG